MGINAKKYIEKFLYIKDKKTNLVPFKLNEPQQKLYDAIKAKHKEGKPIRVIILKARQMGFSTITEGLLFEKTVTVPNVSSAIVAHEVDATNNLFNMSKRFYDNLPELIKPELKANNAKVLEFDFASGNSQIKCYTAGNDGIGRSATIQYLHASEYAFWGQNKADVLLGLLQAVPNEPNTMVIIESTANGYDDFKDRWDKAVAGESEFIPVFAAWHECSEYKIPYSGFELTSEEQELKKLYNLTDDQLEWRRWCIANNCNGNVDKFRQEYPSCPEEAFLMSGRPVFDNQLIAERIAYLEREHKNNPHRHISFKYQWADEETQDKIVSYEVGFGQDIRVYKEPEHGVPYVIGADTKGEGKDFFAATVIHNVTGERVATLHMQVNNSKPFTYQLYCLGRWYNDALVGIEMNFNTAPIEELQRLDYPNQYVRQKYDTYRRTTIKAYGWRTDGNTRPLIIDKEIANINNNIELFNDIPTLREAMSFVYDDNNRPDALVGKHDDMLLSDMIAAEIRTQQSFELEREKRKGIKWRDEQIKDYYQACDSDKELMIKEWGFPSFLED